MENNLIIIHRLFLRYYLSRKDTKNLVYSPIEELLQTSVYLDVLLDTDVMLRGWSSDNEKRVYSSDLEVEGGVGGLV